MNNNDYSQLFKIVGIQDKTIDAVIYATLEKLKNEIEINTVKSKILIEFKFFNKILPFSEVFENYKDLKDFYVDKKIEIYAKGCMAAINEILKQEHNYYYLDKIKESIEIYCKKANIKL